MATTLADASPTNTLAGSAPVTSTLFASAPGRAAASQRPTSAASFAGLRSQAAERVVYVVDGSSAVVSTFTFIQEKLTGSIDRLSPSQRFNVVFFHDINKDGKSQGQPFELFKNQLHRATPGAQHDAAEWIDSVQPWGKSDPMDGLRPAFTLEPDLIFLLSTSIPRTNAEWGAGRNAILKELDTLNPVDERTGRRPVVIKTIQFLRQDPSGLMRDIAQIHGDGEGSFRTLTLDQLDDEPDDPSEVVLDVSDPSGELVISAAAERLAAAERDGSVLAVLYAVPVPDQRRAAGGAAREALELLDAFEQTENADVRAAMLRARAAVILAALDERPATRESLARIALTATQSHTLSDRDAETARRTTHALALAMLGERATAHAEIEALVRDLAKDDPPAATLSEPVLALARVAPGDAARRESAEALARLSRSPAFATDALLSTVFAGARARVLLETTPPSPDALAPLLELAHRSDLIPDDEARRALAYRVIAEATAPHTQTIDWPAATPEAAFARAVIVGTTREGRDEALRLLALVASNPDAGRLAPEALWESAVLRRLDNTDAAQRDASALLARLARDFPDSPHAADALAASINEARGSSGDLPESFELDLIRRAIDRFPERPEIDIWRIDYARRVSGHDRLDALDPVVPGTRQATLACDLYFPAVRALIAGATPTERTRLLRRAVSFAERHRRPEWAPLAADLAQAELDDNPVRAAELASVLLSSESAVKLVPIGHDGLTLLLAEARRAIGDDPRAFDLARALAERLESSSTPADRPRAFWHAWTIMLEVLADQDDAARARARAHLARLRLENPALGGPPFDERLRRLRDRLDSTVPPAADASVSYSP